MVPSGCDLFVQHGSVISVESGFVILATKAEHRYFAEEANLIRDIR